MSSFRARTGRKKLVATMVVTDELAANSPAWLETQVVASLGQQLDRVLRPWQGRAWIGPRRPVEQRRMDMDYSTRYTQVQPVHIPRYKLQALRLRVTI